MTSLSFLLHLGDYLTWVAAVSIPAVCIAAVLLGGRR